MSGHSKWSTIKRKKGAADAKRGKIFSRIIKEIMVAARMGGGDPEGNPRLRAAVLAAKAENMPKDNIERAIKKGTGELEGTNYEEIVYEGYGPGGVAVMAEIMTDNKKRTVAEIRHILSKNGGSLGDPGSVSWIFEKKGVITADKSRVEEDTLMEWALEAGAEDIRESAIEFEIITPPDQVYAISEALKGHGLTLNASEVTMLPKNLVNLEGKQAEQILRMMEALEDHDDVQQVYANFDIPDEVMEKIQ